MSDEPMTCPHGDAGGWPAPPVRRSEPWLSRRELRAAAIVVAALAAAGVVLAPIWEAISPRAKGFVYMPNAVIANETESLVASDGRFVILTCAVGLVAGVAVWLWRSVRGPVVALALGAGGLLGALLTDIVGKALGGGHDNGPVNTVLQLPVEVRGHGLLLAEAVLALLVYAGCALFARRDDLNSPAERGVVGQSVPSQPMRSAP